jgi:hypothetical protein
LRDSKSGNDVGVTAEARSLSEMLTNCKRMLEIARAEQISSSIIQAMEETCSTIQTRLDELAAQDPASAARQA